MHLIRFRQLAAVLSRLPVGRAASLLPCLTLACMLALASAPALAVDLMVSSFTDRPDPATRGGTIVYSAVITNNKDDTASNVLLAVTLDAETSFVTVSDARCSYQATDHRVECRYPTVRGDLSGAGSADRFQVDVTVRSKPSAGSTVSATATVSYDGVDTNADNNTLSEVTTIDNGADLALALAAAPDPVLAGGNLTYTASVTNHGPNSAGATAVALTLSPNLTYVSGAGQDWTCAPAGQVVTCRRSSAEVKAQPPIRVVARVTGAVSGNITSDAKVSISGSATDYVPDNDIASADTRVNPGADLALTKVVSTSRAQSGAAVDFTLRPRNNGPFPATDVVVRDALPAGFVFVSAAGAGWSCGVAGQVVTCTRAAYAVGASSDITVATTAPNVAARTGYTNSATIASTTPDPVGGNDSASVSLDVLPPGVDLEIGKSKGPNPVAQGGAVRSTIVVKNHGPQAARAGEVRVVDTLPEGEDFERRESGSNWECAAAVGRTVTCTYGAALAVGVSTPNLVLLTRAGEPGRITNNACAVYTDSVGSMGDPVGDNNCASAGVTVTAAPQAIDLRIAKTVDVDPLAWNAATVVYTVRVSNVVDAAATGIVMTDTVPGYLSGTGVVATYLGASAGADIDFGCSASGASVTCTQKRGTLGKDQWVDFRIAVTRPMEDSGSGKHRNTASVRSNDQGDLNPADNTASVEVKVEPVADLRLESSVSPASTEAGTTATFSLTVNNDGPSVATGVRVRQQLMPSAGTMTYIDRQPSQGSCSWEGATATLDCDLGSMGRGATAFVKLMVRPDFMSGPPADRTLVSNASVSTTTKESNTANNSAQSTLAVTQAALDLLVNLTDSPDPLGYVPAAAGPVFPDNTVTYHAAITNRGPSVASALVLTYRMEAPAGKRITFLGPKAAQTGQAYLDYCDNVGGQASGGAPLTLTCRFPSSYILADNKSTDLYLDFRVDSPPSPSGDTFSLRATIASNEPDGVPANDSALQNTTIRMRSDLRLAKSARAFDGNADVAVTTVQLRQPFYWVLTLVNAGPGDSQITAISDTLPPGVALYQPDPGAPAPYTAAPYAGGVRWASNNAAPGSGACSRSGNRLDCAIGVLESGKTATVWVPVTVAATGDYRNCASATTSEVDPDTTNNTNICSTVKVGASSLAGNVYEDRNANGARDAGEPGIAGVALALSGTDAYGNGVTRTVNSSGGNGGFTFGNLSPGSYVLTETQPAAFLDGRDSAGTAGGTPGAIGTDRIEGIVLAANTQASGYLFGEVAPASLSGHVFVDTNANAVRDSAERSGISGIAIALRGSDDTGPVERTALTGTAGLYSFANLRPGSYEVSQATIAGVTHTGMHVGSKGGSDGATAVGANSPVPGADKRSIGAIALAGGDSATGYDFGESGQGLSGFVYADRNGNGRRDEGEQGIAGVALTLSGRTAGGTDVCVAISPNPCTVRSGGNGAYAFSGVPASDAAGYRIAQQSQAEAPLSNYADGAEQVGSLGGNALVNDVFDAIVVKLGDFGSDYNFGERAGVIQGRVYLDANDNGAFDAGVAGERGLAGVTVTLSGRSASGADVCTLLSTCAASSDADGRFVFDSLPAAHADGFTLTQTQPLDWAERTTQAGGAGGAVSLDGANSVIGAIKLGAGGAADGYLFGEKAGVLSGHVYIDADNDGVRSAGESGIAGVGLSLSGTTASGLDVCSVTACSATSGADGAYRFALLPHADANGYRITQQAQNAAPLAELLDGKVSAGSNCGACSVDNGAPNSIAALRFDIAKAYTGYDFGELRAASIAGRVYVDANEDGVFQAGEALGAVELTVSGNDDRGNPVSRTATSGADGSYSVTGLRPSGPSGYSVTQTQPAGYLDFPGASGSSVGTVDGTARGSAAQNAVSGIVVGSAGVARDVDFREQGASLAGLVYVDANDNGMQDAGETVIPDVLLTLGGLDARGNTVNLVTRSRADGTFRFSGLAGGTYDLTQTHPAGVLDGRETAGSSGGTVDNSGFDTTPAHNRIAAIALAPGAQATGYLFGERPAPRQGNLFGRVYLDSNGNGRADADEPGIAGVVLHLEGQTLGGQALKLSVTSAASGAYAFTDVAPSSEAGYTISQVQPVGYVDGATSAPSGARSGSPNAAKPVPAGGMDTIAGILVVAGANLAGYDFGERAEPGTSIGGSVYHDANDNGVRDAGEAGIAGVQFTLSGRDQDGKDVQRSAVSGADGGFSFTALAPSDAAGYVLVQTQPAGWGDGKTSIASGLPGIPGAKPVAAGGADSVRAIVLAAGKALDGYLFGEQAGGARLSGSVYIDRNNDGVRDDGETGIKDVTVMLTGTQRDGVRLERSVATDADGRFVFEALAASDAAGYRLAQLQPAGVVDGRTTLAAGLPGTLAGAKPARVGDHDAVSGIVVGAGASLDGYLFGETAVPALKPPIVNGYVWLDRGHRRVRPVDGTLQGLAGWTVELRQHAQRICLAQTDSDGFYQFDNLRCAGYEIDGLPTGDGFAIVFSREGSSLPAVAQSGGNRGKVAPSGGMITDISLGAGEQVIEQNLPLDPAGVVYDAVTRQPVAGAVVSIAGPAGFDPARHLVGAEAALRQTVGQDGMYQFLLQADFPTGVYTLDVQAPGGYLAAPSGLLAPCPGAPVVGLVPTPALVQRSDGAPAVGVPQHRPEACAGIVAGGADSTQYYFGFHITNGGSAPILNNHIPLDPVTGAGVAMTKTTPMVNVARGELVPYTLGASNGNPAPVNGVVVRDLMPPGFKYRPGSARVNGVPQEPTVAGRTLSWPARTLAPQERTSITLVLAVGAGVGEGEYVNQAFAVDRAGTVLSNVATAAVRIVPDATFDCPDILGKVFDDANANGYQDEGEAGLPGIRLATPRGLLVSTDAHGRYHVPCAELPNPDRGSNFVMKLDDRTLPSGYRLTTGNPGDVRVTRGKVARLNFGAAIHRVVRVELSDAAFEAGADSLLAQWKQQIDTMMEQLKKKPSVLRIAYARGQDGDAVAARRVAALRDELAARWRALGDAYPLAIEVEVQR